MVFPPLAKSNCALIFSKFNCPIEEDWAVWILTADLPACVSAYVKLNIKMCHSTSWYFCQWQCTNDLLKQQQLQSSYVWVRINSLFFFRVLHLAGSTKFSGWRLFTLCPCWCVLAKWRRTGLSPSRGQHCPAPRELMDNMGMYMLVCVSVCVCMERTRIDMCANNLCMHTLLLHDYCLQ